MMLNEMLLLELENVLPFTCVQLFLSMPPSLQGERPRPDLCSWPLLRGSAGSGLPAALVGLQCVPALDPSPSSLMGRPGGKDRWGAGGTRSGPPPLTSAQNHTHLVIEAHVHHHHFSKHLDPAGATGVVRVDASSEPNLGKSKINTPPWRTTEMQGFFFLSLRKNK